MAPARIGKQAHGSDEDEIMRPRGRATPTKASGAAVTTTDAPTLRMDQQTAEVSRAALVTFAEEFGRLLARSELGNVKNRRAYSSPEMLLGASVMAVVWVLVARALGWLLH